MAGCSLGASRAGTATDWAGTGPWAMGRVREAPDEAGQAQ